MKKNLLVLLMLLAPFLSAKTKETCYTVELISAKETSTNKARLLQVANYDSSCKMMNISHFLTVRCGCFEKYADARKHLGKFKKKYKDAYVRTTYKSRFYPTNKQNQKKSPSNSSIIQNIKKKKKIVKVEEIAVSESKPIMQVDKEKAQNKLNDLPNDNNVTTIKKPEKSTPAQKRQKHKSKKKKKKKVKLVKKPEASYSYQRYLKALSNKVPIKPYDYRYSFGGEISYDFGYVDQTPPKYQSEPDSYFNHLWRRVRLNHKGNFFDKQLFYEFELSLTGKDRFKDVYVGYKRKIFTDTFYRIKTGNIKIPYSLQRYSTLKNLSFMERPLGDDAFSIKRKLGVEFLVHTKQNKHHYALFLAGYGNSIDELKRNDPDKTGFSVRSTYTHKNSKRDVVHFGAALLEEDFKDSTLRYKQKSESDVLEEKYVSTKIKHVKNRSVRNFDLLYLNHKSYIEAGYMDSTVNARKGDYHFYSYFVEGSYFIIGEGKRFNAKESKFSRVKVTKDTALELALRYSHINLNDKDEHGGEQTNYNFSLNWYITPELRAMMNYIHALPKGTDDYDGALNIYQMRLLFAF